MGGKAQHPDSKSGSPPSPVAPKPATPDPLLLAETHYDKHLEPCRSSEVTFAGITETQCQQPRGDLTPLNGEVTEKVFVTEGHPGRDPEGGDARRPELPCRQPGRSLGGMPGCRPGGPKVRKWDSRGVAQSQPQLGWVTRDKLT